MKKFEIYVFLTFLSLGSVSVSAQSVLDLYFGGNSYIFIKDWFSKL